MIEAGRINLAARTELALADRGGNRSFRNHLYVRVDPIFGLLAGLSIDPLRSKQLGVT